MRKLCILMVVIVSTITSLYAYPIMGARSLGMGGTGVATVNDASAVFWNPGALPFQQYGLLSVKIDAGVDIMQNISPQINNYDLLREDYDSFLAIINDGGISWDDTQYIDDFVALYNKYADVLSTFDNYGVGTNVSLATGVFTHVKIFPMFNLAIGVMGTSDIQMYSKDADVRFSRVMPLDYLSREEILASNPGLTAQDVTDTIDEILDQMLSRGVITTAEYDELYAYLITGAGEIKNSTTFGLENNQSSVWINGIILTEVAFSGSMAFDVGLAKIGVGANFKIIKGYNYDNVLTVDEISNSDDFSKLMEDKFETAFEGSTTGIDLGAYAVMFDTLRVGLVMRNAVVGEIKWGDQDGKLTPPSYIPPTYARIGVAFDPIRSLTLTADADITKLDGKFTEVRNIGLGAEYRIFVLNLRAGMITSGGLNENLDNADVLYTAGVGFDLPVVKLDLAAAIPSGFKGFNFNDTDDVPSRAAVSVSLGIKF